jgi:peptidoglycan/xylan/chitin deacetylase (PgdA/CDA1 family)
MFYLIRTPSLLKKLYPSCTWNFAREEKSIYLSFDDGPHPVATPFVLDALKQYNARATFFCIGKNVVSHPDIYKRILNDGHKTGNHTFNHLNGLKVPDKEYMDNIKEARKYIDSNLFRPPYGRISKFQIRLLTNAENNKRQQPLKIIMWDVLSADFDISLTGEKCSANVTKNARGGSIVVFHDSEKAFPRLEKALPETLKYFSGEGYTFKSVPE